VSEQNTKIKSFVWKNRAGRFFNFLRRVTFQNMPKLFAVERYMEYNFCLNCKNTFNGALTDSSVPTNSQCLVWSTVSLNYTGSLQEGKHSFRAAFLSDDTVDNMHLTMLRSAPTSLREICHYIALTYGSLQKSLDIKTLSLFHSRLVSMQENSVRHHNFYMFLYMLPL